MDDISRIIFDISKNHKLIDDIYIDKILEILINENLLGNYVDSVDINEFNTNSLAFYSPIRKVIYINFKKLLYTTAYMIGNDKLFSQDDNFYLMNLCVLKIILHELHHAKQEKLKNENKKNIESLILINSDNCESYYKKNGLYNGLLYNCNPIERQAELCALLDVVDISKSLNNTRIVSYFKNNYLKKRNQNYSKYINLYPMLIFFNKMIENDKIDYLNSSLTENLKKRLELGLKIEKNDYKNLLSIDF